MSADVNDLTVREPDPLEWDQYDDPTVGQRIPLPVKGVYTLIPTEAPKPGMTKADHYLQFELGPLVVQDPGQVWDQHEIRYTRVNAKRWPNKNASGLADYLRSHGYAGRPASNGEYEQAVVAMVNHPCRGLIDWEARCKQCGWRLKGMDKFPKDETGAYVTRVKCPTCSTTEKPVEAYANAVVKVFVGPTA